MPSAPTGLARRRADARGGRRVCRQRGARPLPGLVRAPGNEGLHGRFHRAAGGVRWGYPWVQNARMSASALAGRDKLPDVSRAARAVTPERSGGHFLRFRHPRADTRPRARHRLSQHGLRIASFPADLGSRRRQQRALSGAPCLCVGRNYAEHARKWASPAAKTRSSSAKPADAVLNVADGETGKMPYRPRRPTCTTRWSWSWCWARAAAIFRSSRPTTASGAMRWAWT